MEPEQKVRVLYWGWMIEKDGKRLALNGPMNKVEATKLARQIAGGQRPAELTIESQGTGESVTYRYAIDPRQPKLPLDEQGVIEDALKEDGTVEKKKVNFFTKGTP